MATDASAINEPLALRARSRRYLGQARDYLSMGELSDACERGYEAAVVIVRAAALQRGLSHDNSHRALLGVVRAVIQECGDRDLLLLFQTAYTLRVHADEGWIEEAGVSQDLHLVAAFIERMGRIVLDAA